MTDRDAVEAARRIVAAADSRDSFPDGRPQWPKDLETIARAFLDLSSRVEEAGWQPIETAPKDGTEIIGAHFTDWGGGSTSRAGPWTVSFWGGKWCSSWDGSEVINYMSDFGTDYKSPDLAPTHWRALPSPPL